MKEFVGNKIKGIILAIVMVVLSIFGNVNYTDAEASDSTVSVDRKADVVFAIDKTGSMGRYIDGVKKNLKDFLSRLDEENVDVRVKFICFGDYGYWLSHHNIYERASCSGWFDARDKQAAIDYLDRIDPYGGGPDVGETPLDGLGFMFRDDFGWREDTAKFCVTLTDDYCSTENQHGETKESALQKLKAKKIYSSVITRTVLFEEYAPFVSEPTVASSKDGGILADILSDYSIILKDLADKVISIMNSEPAIKVKASMIVLKNYAGYEYCVAEMKNKEDGTLEAGQYGDWQNSCVFKSLKPSTKYSFQRRKKGTTDPVTTMEIETESSTGARFDEIPSVLYEGEVYNIKPGLSMKQMLATSGASITWSAAGANDFVDITEDTVGNGCQMIVRDCEYNNNKLLKVILNANISYTEKQSDGTYRMKCKQFKKTFSVENEVDAIEIGKFNGTSENTYQNGIIVLTTKDKVSMDIVLNQGEGEDTPSRQTMKYMITDKYGFNSKYGKKIAKVDQKGQIQGVGPGVTYITIAPKHVYNKYGHCYDFGVTIPVVCPMTDSVKFSLPSTEFTEIDESLNTEGDYMVIETHVGDSIDLSKYIVYNTSGSAVTSDVLVDLGRNSKSVFNSSKMKKTWTSSEPSVAKVNAKGNVTFKSIGYVTITMNPVGGYEINADTGKKRVAVKPCTIIFKVLEKGESEWK